MRFRKRVKIIPGFYLNFSKSGVSSTIGGKGLSVNVGKKGTYLNTSIPGTGIYDRRKISGSDSSSRSANSISSIKSKNTATVLAFLFGGLGIHRFYLGQNGYGFLYLLFCWTYIPIAISIIDGFIFLIMSRSRFNEKHNQNY